MNGRIAQASSTQNTVHCEVCPFVGCRLVTHREIPSGVGASPKNCEVDAIAEKPRVGLHKRKSIENAHKEDHQYRNTAKLHLSGARGRGCTYELRCEFRDARKGNTRFGR